MKKYLLVLLCVGSSAVAMFRSPFFVEVEGRRDEWAVAHKQVWAEQRAARRECVKRNLNDLLVYLKLQRERSKSD